MFTAQQIASPEIAVAVHPAHILPGAASQAATHRSRVIRVSTGSAMNNEQKANNEPKDNNESEVPANAGIDIPGKAKLPDADRTTPGSLPSTTEQASEATGEDKMVQEHRTGRNHSEPTDVTGASNDNAIDSEYIDVGGGD